MIKPVYLGLPLIEISKTLICKFWDDYIKPKYQQNAKTCYILIALLFTLKLEMFMKILKIILKKDLTHKKYEVNVTFPIKNNEKVIEFIRDELGGKIMTEFAAGNNGNNDAGNNDKKAKGT